MTRVTSDAGGAAVWSDGFEPLGHDCANAHVAHIRLRLTDRIDDPL